MFANLFVLPCNIAWNNCCIFRHLIFITKIALNILLHILLKTKFANLFRPRFYRPLIWNVKIVKASSVKKLLGFKVIWCRLCCSFVVLVQLPYSNVVGTFTLCSRADKVGYQHNSAPDPYIYNIILCCLAWWKPTFCLTGIPV